MSPLPVDKLYIDSQFKTTDSVSDSQFKVQRPITLDFPEHTFFVLDDINIPHTWQTIEGRQRSHLLSTVRRYESKSKSSSCASGTVFSSRSWKLHWSQVELIY